MEERLFFYVYGGKLVKLLKEYKEEFKYAFDYNKFSITIEFTLLGSYDYFYMDEKGELADRMIDCLRTYIEAFKDELQVEKIEELISKINESKDEIIDTVQKIEWRYERHRDGLEMYAFLDSVFCFDELYELVAENFSDEFASVDDVTEEDVLEYCGCECVTDVYFYDKRKNIEEAYVSVD